MMRTNQQGLGFIIGNTADAQMSVHVVDFLIKLRSEGRILYIVNRSVISFFFAVYNHSRTSCSKVGMIVCSEEQIKHTVLF